MKTKFLSFFIAFLAMASTQLKAQNMNEKINLIEIQKANAEKFGMQKLVSNERYNIISLDFEKDQVLKKHTTPVDAYLVGIAGELLVTIGEDEFVLKPNEFLTLPLNIPHEVKGITKSQALLIK